MLFQIFGGANKAVYHGKCASGQFKILLYHFVHLWTHVKSAALKH